jgi:hypothetical protein
MIIQQYDRMIALTSIDPRAWPRVLLLDGDLATAEPKKRRNRLLHVAARIARTARQARLAIAAGWPWTTALVTAFTRLAALPRPTGSPPPTPPTSSRRGTRPQRRGHHHAQPPTQPPRRPPAVDVEQ